MTKLLFLLGKNHARDIRGTWYIKTRKAQKFLHKIRWFDDKIGPNDTYEFRNCSIVAITPFTWRKIKLNNLDTNGRIRIYQIEKEYDAGDIDTIKFNAFVHDYLKCNIPIRAMEGNRSGLCRIIGYRMCNLEKYYRSLFIQFKCHQVIKIQPNRIIVLNRKIFYCIMKLLLELIVNMKNDQMVDNFWLSSNANAHDYGSKIATEKK